MEEAEKSNVCVLYGSVFAADLVPPFNLLLMVDL